MADDLATAPVDATAVGGVLTPRVEPLAADELDWRSRLAVWVIARATGEEAPRVFTTIARHPRLFRRWLPFAGMVLLRTDLPRVDVELVVLRTACNASSPYIWTQHVPLAAAAGAPATSIDDVPTWTAASHWSPRQRALLQATDELHGGRVITDGTWAQLEHLCTEHERIELCFVVGHYEMVAMAVNSLGVAPEPTAVAKLGPPATASADAAWRRLARRRAPTAGH